MLKLGYDDIDRIALGASVLGTGGGGDSYAGRLMLKRIVAERGPVPLVTLDELDDDGYVLSSSMMGAPTVGYEKLLNGRELLAAFDEATRILDRETLATYPIEVGGMNALIPLIVGALRNIPVADVDGMGRAFPESQMVTFHLDDVVPDPTVLADERGNVVVIHPADGYQAERFARDITDQMGGTAAVCDYAVPVRQAKKAGIVGSLSLAREIGGLLQNAPETRLDALLARLCGFCIFRGKVLDIRRETRGGFVRGEVTVDGLDTCQGRQMTIAFQNEFLVARLDDGELLAVTPDLITVLDSDTSLPFATEVLRYGARVTVIAIPCDARWRTARGLETVGPRAFGYDLQYEPVEHLACNHGGHCD